MKRNLEKNNILGAITSELFNVKNSQLNIEFYFLYLSASSEPPVAVPLV